MNLKIFLVFFITINSISLSQCSFAKKYQLDVVSASVCPENEQCESPLRNFKFTKVNKTHKAMSYDVNYLRPLDEKVGLQMRIERWSDSGWVNMPIFPFQKDVCRSSLKGFQRDLWIYWGTQMGVPEPDKCPIPAGKFSMKNAVIDLNVVKKIPFWPGKFRVSLIEQLVEDRKFIYCVQMDFAVTEVLT